MHNSWEDSLFGTIYISSTINKSNCIGGKIFNNQSNCSIPFRKFTWESLWRNWFAEIACLGILVMSLEGLKIFVGSIICDSRIESLVSISRYFVLRLRTSFYMRTWALSSFISVCSSLLVICWYGLGIG